MDYNIYWLGVLTPIVVVGAALCLWSLFSLSLSLWSKVHFSLSPLVDLPPDKDGEEVANILKTAIMRSGRAYHFFGLGWNLILVREIRGDDSAPGR